MPQHRGQSAEMQFVTGSEDFISTKLGEELCHILVAMEIGSLSQKIPWDLMHLGMVKL